MEVFRGHSDWGNITCPHVACTYERRGHVKKWEIKVKVYGNFYTLATFLQVWNIFFKITKSNEASKQTKLNRKAKIIQNPTDWV